MSPILTGIVASGISGHLTPAWEPQGAYDALASVAPSGSSTLTFSGIPSGYKSLEISGFVKSSRSGASTDQIWVRFNGDTTSSYNGHALVGDGSAASSINQTQGSFAEFYPLAASQTLATETYSPFTLTILDYASSSKYKTMKTFGGYDRNGGGSVFLWSHVWMKNEPITSIELFWQTAGSTYTSQSKVSLYGVK